MALYGMELEGSPHRHCTTVLRAFRRLLCGQRHFGAQQEEIKTRSMSEGMESRLFPRSCFGF